MEFFWSDAQKPDGVALAGTLHHGMERLREADDFTVGPIEATLKAVAARGICELSGEMEADVVYSCVRCLGEVRERLRVPLHETFTRLPLTPQQEHEDVVHCEGESITVDPYVLQAVALALQPRPLCRPDCRGLCPVCGTDRNISACACETETTDPRFEVLKGWQISRES